MTRARSTSKDVLKGKVRAHDPFELIRWLALSQPDPRKALAELVQNSLDAGARQIRVTRVRLKGVPCLVVRDDGEGIIPEMERPDALKYIATNIGHSRKRNISLQERHRLMTQGQYGIGLLGFWSLGQQLEIRTSMPGHRPHRLVLYRDKPDYRIEPLKGRLALDERRTEIVVVGLHKDAQPTVGGRRAADYLASELRGQLLSREVDLKVEDKMARGRAQKIVTVRPPLFLGERIEGLGPVEVPGYPPIRLEIYLSPGNGDEHAPRGIALYSAGTLVTESFQALSSLGLDREPWIDSRLSGIVDFPAFSVAPGSRRGVLVDAAAGAFARALKDVEPVLRELLDRLERQRQEEVDRGLVRELQRAFRDFFRRQPRYAMLPVQSKREAAAAAAAGDGAGRATEALGPHTGEVVEDDTVSGVHAAPATLLPPGPLSAVHLTPDPLRVECQGRRRARAQARDDGGQGIATGVQYAWSVQGDVGVLVRDEKRHDLVTLNATDVPASGSLTVIARQGGHEVSAQVVVEVLDELGGGKSDEGIPDPEFLHDPGGSWRSRMLEGRWQVNSGHHDYQAVAERAPLKLRYLAMLFAKEVVLRSHQDPRLAAPLEQMVEVTGYADRNLSRKGRRPKG